MLPELFIFYFDVRRADGISRAMSKVLVLSNVPVHRSTGIFTNVQPSRYLRQQYPTFSKTALTP